jgi:hypothetical protein
LNGTPCLGCCFTGLDIHRKYDLIQLLKNDVFDLCASEKFYIPVAIKWNMSGNQRKPQRERRAQISCSASARCIDCTGCIAIVPFLHSKSAHLDSISKNATDYAYTNR